MTLRATAPTSHPRHLLRRSARLLLTASLLGCVGSSTAERRPVVRVAVAANFAAAHAQLARSYRRAAGVTVETSLGATGMLYAQIVRGAPYDVLFAADTVRPALLEAEGYAVPGTRFTYALGRLALFAPTWDRVGPGDSALAAHPIRHLAIAHPQTAPYGAAAREVLERWGLWETLEPRIVRGENVGQAYQFVRSRAADVGLVALSQVIGEDTRTYWVVPRALHAPLRQDAVLLRHGSHTTEARAYLAFLETDEAQRIMASYGYERP